MGWLSMSKQELRRVEVLTEVLAGSRTTESAAGVLGVSLRQAQRLVAKVSRRRRRSSDPQEPWSAGKQQARLRRS